MEYLLIKTNMAFRTKIDYSDNRQIKQREQTSTSLLGATIFGLPFSGLTGGPNLYTSATTAVFENVITTFSGNNSTTIFNFGISQMNGGENYLNTITPINSNDNQEVDPYWVGLSPSINPYFGNTVYSSYSGSSFDFEITNFNEISPNNYTGTAISEMVITYSAATMDYNGDGVWVNVNGKLKTENIIISSGATNGYVLTAIDSSGNTAWMPSSGSGGTAYFTAGSSGISSIKAINSSTIDATGNYSFAVGFNTLASGSYSNAQGLSTKAIGSQSHAEGNNTTASAFASHAQGQNTEANGMASHAQGFNTKANGSKSFAGGDMCTVMSETGFVFGKEHLLTTGGTNSVIIGGSGTTASTANTVYVPYLNIKSLVAGPSTTDIGVDANGNVVDVLSDIRLKENINTIESALDKVLQLRGVTYNWKDRNSGGDDLRIGMIAQEVKDIVPELVTESRNGEYLGVNYGNITALLIEAIKELVGKEEELITSKYVPSGTDDLEGDLGDVVCDDNFMYIKTKDGWKRTALNEF